MGLDITVLIVDWSWLSEVPPEQRLPRLSDAWYADETGLWEWDAPTVESGWVWPHGPNAAFFALYEFWRTAGSFKAHFWAGQRWGYLRDHTDPPLRAELDALLLGLIWPGPHNHESTIDTGCFLDDPGAPYAGLLMARRPDSVRELAAVWERVRPRLDSLRADFDEHAADPDGWLGEFDEFTRLLADWGQVLTEAARRGWGVVGLSE